MPQQYTQQMLKTMLFMACVSAVLKTLEGPASSRLPPGSFSCPVFFYSPVFPTQHLVHLVHLVKLACYAVVCFYSPGESAISEKALSPPFCTA